MTTKFLEIQEGDVFNAYGDILMKIAPIENSRGSVLNCVDLHNGIAYYIDGATDIIKYKIKLETID